MITVKRKVQFTREAHGRLRRVAPGATDQKSVAPGRLPRISRLMALAIRFEGLLQSGEISDLKELARLGHVTQPRMSQILALTLLAPDIQEELLFLPRITAGKATIHEKMLRPIAAEVDWGRQRGLWAALLSKNRHNPPRSPIEGDRLRDQIRPEQPLPHSIFE